MVIVPPKTDDKRGKQHDALRPHKEPRGPMFQATRLEGKVKNVGIKNIGHQKRKAKAHSK